MRTEVALLLPLIVLGVLACMVRLWWIWWQSACNGCGLLHQTCECPASDHVMRPRK